MDNTMNRRQELENLIELCLAKYPDPDNCVVTATDTINIIKALAEDTLPRKTIENQKNNWNTKKPDNVIYHLLRIIPKLFIASLHNETPIDPVTLCPLSGLNFKTKFLSRRLKEPFEEIHRLEKKLDQERDNNHYDEMIDYKNELKQIKEDNKELKEQISKLQDKIAFKEEMLETRVPKQALYLKDQELLLKDKQIEELQRQIRQFSQK